MTIARECSSSRQQNETNSKLLKQWRELQKFHVFGDAPSFTSGASFIDILKYLRRCLHVTLWVLSFSFFFPLSTLFQKIIVFSGDCDEFRSLLLLEELFEPARQGFSVLFGHLELLGGFQEPRNGSNVVHLLKRVSKGRNRVNKSHF